MSRAARSTVTRDANRVGVDKAIAKMTGDSLVVVTAKGKRRRAEDLEVTIFEEKDGRARPQDELAGGGSNVLVEKGDDSVGIVGGGHVNRTETAGGLFLLLGSEGEEGKVALIGRSKHGNFW